MRKSRNGLLAALLFSLPALGATVDDVARDYVQLVLALGEHAPDYVDAYYGPDEWQRQAKQQARSPADIASAARELQATLAAAGGAKNELDALRLDYLRTQLGSLAAYASSLSSGEARDFDREARALYDTNPPTEDLSSYDPVLADLEKLLPGEAPLHQRMERFNKAYEIPQDRLAAVFEAAIAACRERTARYIELPANESFRLEYVKDKPWSGYNWYQGDAHSLIQINTDLPVRIDRAIDLGCHEGYPGHHTYNALLESAFVEQRGWVEFSVYPLFSPQSLIAEGTANYGIELAFPGREKLAFEKEVLYPLAGLDPATADRYDQVQSITRRLSFARNEIARRYINGSIDRETAIDLSQTYGPSSRARAEQSVRFIDNYGAYVINYNWGKQLVQRYIEAGTDSNQARWRKFHQLLASPRLPSSLEAPE